MPRMRIDDSDIPDADVFSRLLDYFPDMIQSVDEDGNIVFANRTASSLLGYDQDELLTMNIRDIYAEEVLAALETGFKDLKKKGDKRVESVLKHKDGTQIAVEIRSFSIYDDDGEFMRTFSIMRDMRPIKELQNSLIHAGRLAAIGEMSSGIAHDINNPLTVIELTNELLRRELSQLDLSQEIIARLKQLADDTRKASGVIKKLSDHLQNFSRGVVEVYSRLDIADIMTDATFIAKNRIMSASVTLNNEIENNQYYTAGSPNQLEQVFMNLVSNACDAMRDLDTRELTLRTSSLTEDETEYWSVDVSDTGHGMPEDLMDEVFRSFFTTKEKGKGTGLGLSIARGIARNHKGDIRVTSSSDAGTTFSVLLPKAPPPD